MKKRHQKLQKIICTITLVASIGGVFAGPIKAGETGQKVDAGVDSHQTKHKQSLIDNAPQLYTTAKRYPKFYGDENTTHGSILERSELFGNPGGLREQLVDNGFYVDFGVTQFLQSNVSGGNRTTSSARANGSADGWLWLDTAKAGLWSGGAVFLHGEGQWDWGINRDVGSTLPANQDATMPTSDPDASQWALSEAYILQSLPGNLLAAAGKIDLAAWADSNTFANNERTQFLYTGLINNPIVGSFIPYTALGAWVAWSPNERHSLVGVFSQTEGAATESGFDTLFNGNNTWAVEYKYSPTIGNRPGNYHLITLYTSKSATNFQISDRHFIAEVAGAVPVDEKSDNYTLLLNFDQYLWIDDKKADAYKSHHNAPVGFGVFGRSGWTPKDRNVIDQFYSLGIGGYGMLIPGRDNDNWGIGWSGTHISSDLRDFPVGLRSFEHAGEIFYNFWLTPAIHLSLSSQVIRPADDTLDTAWSFSSRLQVDF